MNRPPIVTVMGHIDHGKTTLLDKIRSSNVCARESGGITQHIGAYQACDITFIDTPGHAAFTKMRSRGAKVTDICILVIAGTEGIMAQTKECLNLIKNAQIPTIIALNKMDLDGFNPDKVKGQLVEAGFTPEEYGGDTPIIPVSAKSGKGIDKLLETIKMIADLLELKSEPGCPLEATIIESRLDKAKGPLVTAIVTRGTLNLGDIVFAGKIRCKVKSMLDCFGKTITKAIPSTPLELLGFEAVPAVGGIITSEPKEETIIIPELSAKGKDDPRLKILIKADTHGTLEAINNSLSDDVQLLAVGVGGVTDNDIAMASSGNATIYAFNVKTDSFIKKLAENEKIPIFESKIIYEIIDDIQSRTLHMLEPTIDETVLGEGEIIAEFSINKVRIAGIKVIKGEMGKGDLIHLKRDGKIIKDTKLDNIQHGKDILDKAKAGNEYGMTFKPYVDFKIKDGIIAYKK